MEGVQGWNDPSAKNGTTDEMTGQQKNMKHVFPSTVANFFMTSFISNFAHFIQIFHVILSMWTKVSRSINLWRMKLEIGKIHLAALGDHYERFCPWQIFMYFFLLKIKNHLLGLIPTKIDQIWKISLYWRHIWYYGARIISDQNSNVAKFGVGGAKKLKSPKWFIFKPIDR